jgi:hypothetical protein
MFHNDSLSDLMLAPFCLVGDGDVFENLHFSLLDEIRVTPSNANLEVRR